MSTSSTSISLPRVSRGWRRPTSRCFHSIAPTLFVAAASLAFGQGCAFANLTVAPPPPQELAQPSNLGKGRVVTLMPLTDQRPMPERCGMQKNGYNMDTANVYCAVTPPIWLSQALAQGLTSAGFRVSANAEAQATSSVQIDGAVLQFFVEPDVGFFSFTPEADISVKLVVTSRTGLRAERVFYFKGVETSLIGTEANFQRAASQGTRQAVAGMVSSIAALLDRYPDLGKPDAVASPTPAVPAGKEVGL